MKAIVNVNTASNYAKYNGLTFEVKELLSHLIALNIDGRTVDFTYTEVVICDLQNEMQKAFDDYNWGSDDRTHIRLAYYTTKNNIHFQPKYNCPA